MKTENEIKYTINTLTDEQTALLKEFHDAWLDIVTTTTVSDHEIVERGLELAYKTVNRTLPKIEWYPSPLSGIMAVLVSTENNVSEQAIGKLVWAQEIDKARDVVIKHVAPDVIRTVKTTLMSALAERASLVVLPIALELAAQGKKVAVKGETGEKLVKEILKQTMFAYHDAGWYAFYDFMHRGLGLTECANVAGIVRTAKGGWYWPFENMVVATERPIKVLCDDNNKPHCEDGPAIEYKDGFSVYSWHGVRVPPEAILHPDGVTWEEVEAAVSDVDQVDSTLKDALAEIKALKWSQNIDGGDKDNQHLEAALAVKRLGGIGAMKDLIDNVSKSSDGV